MSMQHTWPSLISDQIVTLTSIETEEYSVNASLHDNFQELDKTVPEWDQETQVIHPKRLEHHQSGHLTKNPGCVWKKQAARSITVERKVTAVQDHAL